MIWKDYAAGCCIFRRLVPSRSPTVNCSSPIEFLAALFSTGRAVQHLAAVRESFRAGGVGFTIMDLQAASRGEVGDCRQRADGVGWPGVGERMEKFRLATGLRRRNWHRTVFLLAGVYNLSWGLLSVAYPDWFFRLFDMERNNYPEIFACLGMVLGLYGILYVRVAYSLEKDWPIAAVGLAGKTLGPLAWFYLVWVGRWPPATLLVCLSNDLMWWLPFWLYLYDVWHLHRNPGNCPPDDNVQALARR
jgi:hypothetical protein